MSHNNSLKSFVIAVAVLAASFTMVLPQKAQAIILASMNHRHRGYYYYDPSAMFLCILVFPICFLDEDGTGASIQADKATLEANLYSPDQVTRILANQNAIQSHFQSSGQYLVVQPGDTAESVIQHIQAQGVEVNADYADYLHDRIAE